MSKKITLVKRLNSVEEYEREPIPQSKLKGLKSFIGMYAGEHTAGTEFVIGPLFVAHGASAFDVVVGLLIGNLLAVLSWAFLCAPIAVKARMTMYFQLEKICGPNLVKVYNLVNGLMFCFLAGSMIAVSATAVGIPFDMPMPSLGDMLPNSFQWIVTVGIIGAVTTVIAMFGYQYVSKFANIAAPWMILIFFAAAFAILPQLGVTSLSSFWEVANDKIWTGVALEGQSKFSFLHVMFFAWFANMAMHIGMSDLTIFRYAKKWQYGLSSATGMYIGHYFAWLAAGILYAVVLVGIVPEGQSVASYLPTLSQGALPSPAPGPLAYNAAGLAGVICVVIAGWTTANPTIYRAGLALQSVLPKIKTWKTTLITGAVTTLAACFPALVMKLLSFVAIYGFILMPMGAIIFIDFYLMKKLGLTSYYAEKSGIRTNWAAGIAWILTLVAGLLAYLFLGIEEFFLGLPGWFVAAILYIVLSKVIQKSQFITSNA